MELLTQTTPFLPGHSTWQLCYSTLPRCQSRHTTYSKQGPQQGPQLPRELCSRKCRVSSDHLQSIEPYEDVSHLSDGEGSVSHPIPSLLYDGIGYFVALTGMFLRCVIYSRPTLLRTAVNMANIFLYRGRNYFVQTSGYLLSIYKSSLCTQHIYHIAYRLGMRSPQS